MQFGEYKKPKRRIPPQGFRYVGCTAEELEDYRKKHNGRRPSVYRLECFCGKRIWGSGLGIGAHRRVCFPTFADLKKFEDRKER
jgi:hypothetical protein